MKTNSISDLRPMKPVTAQEFNVFLSEHPDIAAEINTLSSKNKDSYGPPFDYEAESTTVWSFPDRGKWATHNGHYRGNWSPYVPRNLILKYTVEGDTVLDQMCGSGTTVVECKLLNRNGIGIDINPKAAMWAFANITSLGELNQSQIKLYTGDARNLNEITPCSIDLIATHPPYAGIIPYSRREIDADLSALSIQNYIEQISLVAREALRVLKPKKYCAILIGDTRKHLHYIPLAYAVMHEFLNAGFILKEDIIKLQWNTKTTREKWRGKSYDFYKIAHEHLFIFRKPDENEKLNELKYSTSGLIK